MAQALIAYSAVAFSALYVGWKFMPATMRRWFAARMGALMHRGGLSRERVLWLEAKANSDGACGGCDSCHACATEKPDVRA